MEQERREQSKQDAKQEVRNKDDDHLYHCLSLLNAVTVGKSCMPKGTHPLFKSVLSH